jgi:ribosomal protein L4
MSLLISENNKNHALITDGQHKTAQWRTKELNYILKNVKNKSKTLRISYQLIRNITKDMRNTKSEEFHCTR